jgi:hypothetical protein
MVNKLQKARLSWQRAGKLRTLQIAMQRYVPSWVFDTNSVLAVKLSFADDRSAQEDPKWPHRWGAESDLPVLTQSGIAPETVRSLFREGARVAMCEKDGTLVAYTWFLTQPHVVYDWIRVAPQDAPFIYLAYVSPAFRGQHIHLETRLFAYAALAELGYSGIISFIEHLNRSSLRTGKTTPRRYLGRLTYVRVLGFTIYRLDGKWGAGFYGPTRPFELDFDEAFDEANFHLRHKHATTSLDS